MGYVLSWYTSLYESVHLVYAKTMPNAAAATAARPVNDALVPTAALLEGEVLWLVVPCAEVPVEVCVAEELLPLEDVAVGPPTTPVGVEDGSGYTDPTALISNSSDWA